MADFITIEQADAHLRLDFLPSGDDREDDLNAKMDQAEAIVLDYLKKDASDYSGGAPDHVVAAILLVLTALWDDRDGASGGDYINPGGTVANLLHRERDPALA